MSIQAFQQLMEDQMIAFANHLSDQFSDLDREQIVTNAREHCSGLNLVDAVSKLPKKSNKRSSSPKRAATPIDPTCQCMARVWQSGSGLDQCARGRIDGQDYCKTHAKKAMCGVTACQVEEEGKGLASVPAKLRIGLWCGRIDEWQDGEEGIPPYKDSDGIIRIEWSNETIKARIASELEEGTARHAGERRPRSRKSKTPTTLDLVNTVVNEEDDVLMDALETELPKVAVLEEPVSAQEPIEKSLVEEPVSAPEPIEESLLEEPASAPEPDGESMEDSNTDDLEEMLAEEEDMEVDEREYNGETYYIDSATGDIYDIDAGTIIGKWDGDADTGKPTLN